ncbi:MAG: hypothetical protein JNK05_09110 [Myxococcales bacterium]|nr:hypothetical protein [Myxococcales bacterium]
MTPDVRRNDASANDRAAPADVQSPPMDVPVPPADTGVEPADSGTGPMCGAGETSCGGRCVNTQTDAMNCGACGTACASGMACMAGRCQATCDMGTMRCGSSCVDTATNAMHCGACDMACPSRPNATSVCMGGACAIRCGAGFADCDMNPANGCEVDTSTSVMHCGRCGNVCVGNNGTPSCSAGACSFTCNAGFGDCDTNPANGCEVNTNTAQPHCGRCGNACPVPTGGSATCSAGTCGGTCPAGQTLCGTSCINTQSDNMNCGACGTVCAGGMVCSAGRCGAALPTRYTQTTSTQPFLSACTAAGRQTVLTSVDDSTAATTLPFAIRFWDQNLAAGAPVTVSSNGNIQLLSGGSTLTSGSIPSTSTPNATIAPYWRDLVTSTSGVCIATFGTAPNRQWVVQWQSVTHYSSGTGPLTFEVVITETTNTIDLVYGTMSSVLSAAVGVENTAGTLAVGGCAAMATSCAPASNSRVRFVPSP